LTQGKRLLTNKPHLEASCHSRASCWAILSSHPPDLDILAGSRNHVAGC